VLLRVQAPHQVWPRAIEAQLNTGDAGDLWNIDAFRMQSPTPRARAAATPSSSCRAPSSRSASGTATASASTTAAARSRSTAMVQNVAHLVRGAARGDRPAVGGRARSSSGPIELREIVD
jgi:hypothetical protein